jgi:hypothetical protein
MEDFNLKKFLVENKLTTNSKLIKESQELPELLDDETVEDALTSRSGYLMNSVVVELPGGQWYKYGEVDSSDPFWEELQYSDDQEENTAIIFEQDIIEGSERTGISKHIKALLQAQGIEVVNVYLGEV